MAVKETPIAGTYVKSISTAQLFELQDIKGAGDVTEAQATREFGVSLMLMSACDAEGVPLWKDKDALLALPAAEFMAVYEVVCTAALALNGLGDEEEDQGND